MAIATISVILNAIRGIAIICHNANITAPHIKRNSPQTTICQARVNSAISLRRFFVNELILSDNKLFSCATISV